MDYEHADSANPSAPQPRLLFQRVQKRDGTLVDFDRNKIAHAILSAMRATGSGDMTLADQMADRVMIYLARNYEDQLLNIEDIQDAVESVLMDNGLGRVAKAYILYRNERARRRELKIQTSGHPRPPRDILSTEVERTASNELVSWNRDRIVEALVRETGLARETAVRISREVEEQLIFSRATTITTDLIRELVNAKLVEFGHSRERVLHARLGVPLYDVEKALTGAPIPPESTDLALAGAILREYGLRRIFPEDVVEAHLRGEVMLNGLERVTRPAGLVLSPSDLLKFGLRLPHALAHARPARYPETLVAHVVKASTALHSSLAGSVGWDALDVIFGPLVHGASDRELEQLAQTVVFDFSQQSEAQGGRPLSVDLHLYGIAPRRLRTLHVLGPGGKLQTETYGDFNTAISRFALALVRAFAKGDGRGHPFVCPRLVVHITDELLESASCVPFLEEVWELAARWGTPLFAFDRDDEDATSAGLSKYPWQQRCGFVGEVTLNLAQAALLVGNDKQSTMDMLMDFVRLAVKGHMARRTFLGRMFAQNEQGPLAMLCLAPDGDPLFQLQTSQDCISLLGLDEMLLTLVGQRLGEGPEANNLAVEVIDMLVAETERYSTMHDVRFCLQPAGNPRQAVDAAFHDRRHFGLTEDAPMYYLPAGITHPQLALSAEERIRTEEKLHGLLHRNAVTLLDGSQLPTSSVQRLELLRQTHDETFCQHLAAMVPVTVCQSCDTTARGFSDICTQCASSRVTGLARLFGPLEVLPRWDGACLPVIESYSEE